MPIEGLCFSRTRSEGSRFTWGSGGEAVFAKFWVCFRNRWQPSATVGNRPWWRRKALHSGECVWRAPEISQIDSRCRSYIGVCRGGVCVSDLWRRRYIGVCRGGVSVSDLCRRSFIGVCRGGVCVSDLCRRSYIGVCGGGVCVSDLWRRRYIGVCRGGVSVSDLCRRSFIGVCRGGVCVSDLCRRSFIGVCRGVSVWVICVAAVLLAFAEECLCEWSVPPQFYWRLQRRCLCEWSVSPQFHWRLQRGCLCEWSVSPQFHWRLQRKCLCQVRVSYRILQECLTRVPSKKCQVRSVK